MMMSTLPLLPSPPPDIQRATGLARRFVFYYGMSDLGITSWAMQPYSHDFFPGQTRPRKVRGGGHV